MAVTRKSAAPARKTTAAKPAAAAEPVVTALSVLKQLSDAFDALNAFRDAGGFEGVAFAATASAVSGSKKSTPAAAKESAAATPVELDEEETRNLNIKELRALAVELGLDEQKAKSAILDELEEKGYFGEADDEEEDDEEEDDTDEDDDAEEDDEDDDEEDEEDEEDEPYTREELEEMDLKELRAIAKADGHKVAEYRGLDQEGLIVLILGDDEADEDDEDDVEELDEDQLKEMPLDELKKLAKELGVKVPPRITQPKLVELILDAAAE